MAKRVTKVVDDVTYRVFRLPKSLRLAASKAKGARGLTVRQFLDQAVIGESLPKLVAEIKAALGSESSGQRGPARLPFSDSSLALLRAASAECGLPASLLFERALGRASVASGGTAKGKRGQRKK